MPKKALLKLFIPPIAIKLFSPFKKNGIQFQKTDLSFDDASKKTAGGYSAENILTKCRDSLLKVKNGEYPYERDSVLFNEKQLFFPLLASLFYVSSRNNNTLNIIDFGGSLGSTYFQNRDILKQAGVSINWNIIEQENFVKCGKEHFSNEELRFFNNADELNSTEISVCLFSSVLPYLKEPYAILDFIAKLNIKYVIIDRTLFVEQQIDDILSIQNVPPEIYKASYPAWFLSLEKFLNFIGDKYNIIFEWDCSDNCNLFGYKINVKGFFLERVF
jgi:putative methyltransferase (TIGR04325 family)